MYIYVLKISPIAFTFDFLNIQQKLPTHIFKEKKSDDPPAPLFSAINIITASLYITYQVFMV